MMEAVDSHTQPAGFIRRYLFSTDHKVIAKQYLLLSLTMALIGGFTSYLIRWQLAWPETDIPGWGPIGPDNYNAIITMHGTVMVFFCRDAAAARRVWQLPDPPDDRRQ